MILPSFQLLRLQPREPHHVHDYLQGSLASSRGRGTRPTRRRRAPGPGPPGRGPWTCWRARGRRWTPPPHRRHAPPSRAAGRGAADARDGGRRGRRRGECRGAAGAPYRRLPSATASAEQGAERERGWARACGALRGLRGLRGLAMRAPEGPRHHRDDNTTRRSRITMTPRPAGRAAKPGGRLADPAGPRRGLAPARPLFAPWWHHCGHWHPPRARSPACSKPWQYGACACFAPTRGTHRKGWCAATRFLFRVGDRCVLKAVARTER